MANAAYLAIIVILAAVVAVLIFARGLISLPSTTNPSTVYTTAPATVYTTINSAPTHTTPVIESVYPNTYTFSNDNNQASTITIDNTGTGGTVNLQFFCGGQNFGSTQIYVNSESVYNYDTNLNYNPFTQTSTEQQYNCTATATTPSNSSYSSTGQFSIIILPAQQTTSVYTTTVPQTQTYNYTIWPAGTKDKVNAGFSTYLFSTPSQSFNGWTNGSYVAEGPIKMNVTQCSSSINQCSQSSSYYTTIYTSTSQDNTYNITLVPGMVYSINFYNPDYPYAYTNESVVFVKAVEYSYH